MCNPEDWQSEIEHRIAQERRHDYHALITTVARMEQRLLDHVDDEQDRLAQLETQMEWLNKQFGTWDHRWKTWIDRKRAALAIGSMITGIVLTEVVRLFFSGAPLTCAG